MKREIGLGFHTCVDYELVWDTEKIKEKIRSLDIRKKDVQRRTEASDEKQLWGGILYYLEHGVGGEIVPETEELCEKLGESFVYQVTLGGTATRAAIALGRLEVPSILQTSCNNHYVRDLMPGQVQICSDMKEEQKIYPHVVLQCEAGVRIQEGEICFITPRENRILISRDATSLKMDIRPDGFGKELKHVKIFLLGSFSQILEEDFLEEALERTNQLLKKLPEDAVVIMEDGCYVKKKFRQRVHQALAHRIDVLSMNEDELAEFVGEKVDVLNRQQVAEAVETAYKEVQVKTMVVHSSAWALAVGTQAKNLQEALECGVALAGTRFRKGDGITKAEFEKTRQMQEKVESQKFLEEIKGLIEEDIEGVACKELSCVETPTVVGLGDAFAGGLLYGLWQKWQNKRGDKDV
ncbi:hypothetical protein FYJ34_07800 [Clostridiaceae bacterium 68-1-5]|uniref:ADP-dependent glucokinase n=1 Tax=Suipraeoptans intestinalis TaxID=2606628 RepID=A0A6N7V4P7_9FIRM|nr:ADP-dependent glucokinase/phosphofructokinase [Suipraeoptans intestinalis]MSR94162.1 hypothetical protein [Suipraeoptans intestinalis]